MVVWYRFRLPHPHLIPCPRSLPLLPPLLLPPLRRIFPSLLLSCLLLYRRYPTLLLRQLSTVLDLRSSTPYAAIPGAKTLQIFYNCHTGLVCLVDFAKDNMLAIQPGTWNSGDEEL
jgi:hypothetical protein